MDREQGSIGHVGDEGEFVVQSMHTATNVYTSPDGHDFVYLYVEWFQGGDQPPFKMLINPPLCIGLMGDINNMLKVIFGVKDLDAVIPDHPPAEGMWEEMPPPPENPEDDPYDGPDRTGDR